MKPNHEATSAIVEEIIFVAVAYLPITGICSKAPDALATADAGHEITPS